MSKPDLVETLDCMLVCLNEGRVEIEVIEDEKVVFYTAPADEFLALGIELGHDFFIEIYNDKTAKIVPKIVYGPQQEISFLTREELEAEDDLW